VTQCPATSSPPPRKSHPAAIRLSPSAAAKSLSFTSMVSLSPCSTSAPHTGAPLARAATWPISRRRSRPLSAHAHRRNAPLRLAWLGIRHAYGSNPMATPTPAGALLSRRGPPGRGPGQETLGRRNLCRHGRGATFSWRSRRAAGPSVSPWSGSSSAPPRTCCRLPRTAHGETGRRREIEGDSPRVNASSRYPALPPGNFGRTPDARAAL
jgi:hypothetical protein